MIQNVASRCALVVVATVWMVVGGLFDPGIFGDGLEKIRMPTDSTSKKLAEVLEGHSNLKSLWLDNARAIEADAQSHQEALPDCRINPYR